MTDGGVDPPRAYPGAAHGADLPAGRAAGRVRLEAERVRLVAAGGDLEVALPLAGALLRLGGVDDGYLFFSHPDHSDTAIWIETLAALDDPRLQATPALAGQVGSLHRRRRRGRRRWLLLAAALLLALVVAVWAAGALVSWLTRRLPPGVETEIGDLVWSQLAAGALDDPALDAELARLAAPLLASLGDTPYAFRLHLLADPAVNAFALPGGHLALTSGLLLQAERPAELLGVLAHETAHVTARHSLRQILRTVGLWTLVRALIGDPGGITGALAGGGVELLGLAYSRDLEREADDLALDRLLGAGFDPRGLLDFLSRLEAAVGPEAGGAGPAIAFLSTHPAGRERVERLEERLATLAAPRGPPRTTDFDLAAFQERLRRALEQPE